MAKLIEITGKALSGEWGLEDESRTGIPVLRTTNFTNLGIINYGDVVTRNITKKNISEKFLRKGDIIIEKSGGSDKQPVGRVVLFNGEENRFLFNNFTGVLRVKDREKWVPDYVFYALFANYRNGGTRKYENKTTGLHNLKTDLYINNYEIEWINIAEQKNVCATLRKIESIISDMNKEINYLDELIKARFVEMFKGKYDLFKVGEKLKTTSGGTPKSSVGEYYDGGDIPWLTSGEVNYGDITKPSSYITEKGLKNSSAKWVPENSIVIAMYGATAGKVGIVRYKTTTNQAVCSVLPNNNFNQEFLRYAFQDISEELTSKAIGGGQLNISQTIIKNSYIVDAPIEEQERFASFAKQVDKSKFTLQNNIISLMNLCSLCYNMSNMFASGYMGKLELIRALPTKEEKAKASRLVLREVLEQIFPEKSVKKKKKYSLLELIDCSPIKNYINDDQVTKSLHFIRIIGIRAEHNQSVREKDVKIAVDNLENFIKFLNHRNESTEPIKSPEFFTEAETRATYIDTYLREAGWNVLTQKGVALPGKAGIEIEVGNMPNNAGVGYCDYVLYDRAGKPLAVVEAKRTSKDPQIGRHQADLYAESLKEKFGYKPVIYYTNGYETHVIDGVYPDRKVTAFHTLEELERMIQRRTRGNITDMAVKDEIAGRPYQKMALTRMCERFNTRHRRGLVVMATGTGKTRVSIALTDILVRNGWIKNVLFLADRTSLVKQAKRNYAKLLPDMTICELSEGGSANKDVNARLMFCTYQTMINYIDAEDKDFSTGRFDLIIVDEAHRSIFNRYASIFAYFDSLLVGFTATPRDEVGSSTYGIFECESGEPTFDYPLEDAIKEHYLVGYEVVNRHSRIMAQGIKREELDEDQLEQLDDFLEGDHETPDLTIPANAIFRSIFNKDTCRSVIEDLMEKSIRVNGGETIGKTIIFAYNHKHAEMIVNEFKKLYPHLPPNTCQLVDYSVNYAEDLVARFDTDDEFRVAVSVDMLDTGIDIPAVLNLMFFKPVRSKIKFVQMIGRGTRLCSDLFGPGKDKKKFLIFDYCDNFEYFQVEHNEVVNSGDKISLSQRIFALRSEIAYSLQDFESQENEFLSSYRNKTVRILLDIVKDLKKNTNRIAVRQNLKYIDKYNSEKAWTALTPVSIHELKTFVAPLIEGGADPDFKALSFDIRMMRIQRAILKNTPAYATADIKKVREIAQYLLQNKMTIPQVETKKDDLKELYDESSWNEPQVKDLERLRDSVRELIKYITGDELRLIDIDVSDELIDPEFQPDGTVIDIRTYKERVIDYLTKNDDDATIEKIRNLEKLDQKDADKLKQLLWFDLGSEDEYNENANGKSLAAFVRSLIGIDQEAVNEKFGEYLNAHQLNSKQQEFINVIVKYVQKNGDIELSDLLESDPFKSIDWNELFGGDVEPIKYTVSILHDAIAA